MFQRVISPLKSNSFFLFGPRGTGKTTFLKQFFEAQSVLWIDLLLPRLEETYALKPETLTEQILAQKEKISWVVIDEIQKNPKLLDLVHYHIENSQLKFALTGSSARKLKRGHANLLAGRAFVYYLFPLTYQELGENFVLNSVLQWGSLPHVVSLVTDAQKQEFLWAYAHTYLKEEIWAEHLIRELQPFRKFLEIAAQNNGDIVNFLNIAKDVGADPKTIQSYYQILEDTLVGFLLEPFNYSIRKRQTKSSKFYFFDTGVKRALDKTLTQPLLEQTYGYGDAFEHFLIIEIHRLNLYGRKDFSLSYLRTKDDAEIDLLVERPGMPLALIEIKSKERVDERDVALLNRFVKDFQNAQAFCFSRDPMKKKIGSTLALPWQEGLKELGVI